LVDAIWKIRINAYSNNVLVLVCSLNWLIYSSKDASYLYLVLYLEIL
jgi:hypothetical protein